MNNKNELPESNRRDFLKNASLASMMAMIGGVSCSKTDAQAKSAPSANSDLTKIEPPPPINVGVIGLNEWGREILKQIALLPSDPSRPKLGAHLVAICDNYPSTLRRAGKEDAPNAQKYDDYTKLLADPNVQAVIIATPTSTHKEIALAALAAGKHVYCEAPLANTIEDAKAIAKAARDAFKLVFQPGLQQRSHPQIEFLVPFIRSGAIGKYVMVRAQWHQNTSWYRTWPDQTREDALNWRLHNATSTGLLGEEGIHQIDIVGCILKERPKAVTGFSSTIRSYEDHRDVPDTVQAIFEFPHGVSFFHDLTICNSFEKIYEVYLGTESGMMMRDFKAWLFKEVDADNLGWEVYARHDVFYNETGIALVANASKQTTLAGSAQSFNPYDHQPLYYALEAFTDRAANQPKDVQDFQENYPDGDAQALIDYLKGISHIRKPAATWQDGLDATVLAIKANEAAVKKQKITIEKEWFEI
jgi:predicted dehydrogenase